MPPPPLVTPAAAAGGAEPLPAGAFSWRRRQVKRGDTLTHIARAMDVEVEDLARANHLRLHGRPGEGAARSADDLHEGEWLAVPPRGTCTAEGKGTRTFTRRRRAPRHVDEYLSHPRIVRLFKALRMVETSNMWPPPDGDGGESIGALQISKAYHRDAWEGEVRDPDSTYARLRWDLEYSKRTCLRYWLRWVPWSLAILDEEALARAHNGGPLKANTCTRKTARYWRKVRGELLFGVARVVDPNDREHRLRDWGRATEWGHRTSLHPVPIWSRLRTMGDPRWRDEQPMEARCALAIRIPIPPWRTPCAYASDGEPLV